MANGYCRKCGYSLIGLDRNRCPECGQPFDPADPRTMRPYRGLFPSTATVLRRWLILSAILVMGSLGFQQWHDYGWSGADFRLEANWIDMGLPFPWLSYCQVEGYGYDTALPGWRKSIVTGFSLHPMAMVASILVDLGLALLVVLLVQAKARRRGLEPNPPPLKWIALSVGAGLLAGLCLMIGVRGLVWLVICILIVSAAACGLASWRARTWKSVLLISLCFSLAYWWSNRMTIFGYFSRSYSMEPAENLLLIVATSIEALIIVAPVAFISRRVAARRAARVAPVEKVAAESGSVSP